MKKLIKDLIDNGERGYVSKDFINLLVENEPKERGISWDHQMRMIDKNYKREGLKFIDSFSIEPKEGYEPIILVDNPVTEEHIGDPVIIIYTYNGEIRMTGLNSDAHANDYIYKII